MTRAEGCKILADSKLCVSNIVPTKKFKPERICLSPATNEVYLRREVIEMLLNIAPRQHHDIELRSFLFLCYSLYILHSVP